MRFPPDPVGLLEVGERRLGPAALVERFGNRKMEQCRAVPGLRERGFHPIEVGIA